MAGGTNFEGLGHPQLKSMVAGSEPSKVTGRGNQLKDAGRVLDELSKALAAHVAQIQWEGPAAENFKTWASDLHKSASMIGEFSKGAGDAMVQAGEALSTAKTGVPEVPAKDIDMVKRHSTQPCIKPSPLSIAGIGNPSASTDAIMKKEDPTWVSNAEAAAAQKRVDTAHQEAIHQMESLGQAYEAATTKLNSLKMPELPGQSGGESHSGAEEVSVGGGGGGRAGSGGTVRTPRSGYSGSREYSPSGGGDTGGGSVTPRPPVPTPHGPTPPGHSTPTPPHGSPVPLPGDPNTPGSVTPTPTHPGDRPGTGLDSLPALPTAPGPTGPVGPGGGPGPVFPQSGGPGHPGTPGGGPLAFPGGGPIPFSGTGPFTGGTGPLKSGGGPVPPNRTSTVGGSLPAKNGGSGPTNGGTVFGSREAQGRPGAGGFNGPGGGMHQGGGGHGGGGAVGGARGRGYSSTGGGVIGGTKGPAAGGEFTPGGSGLRSRAAAAGAAAEGAGRPGQNGMMGPGMAGGAGGRRERDHRNRADYLHEDEETWTSGTPKSNPGVIE
ncbi:WXG100 family type VII secretion target [Kitasatospora misakiensis]|uniref:WXG100 family type VII secretion target n=1 Tax=Kitasatospora misakiensis TaxID=67330 RepID=A0ABW0XAI8_9ACTN